MSKRLAIVIGVAAAGVMALGAQTAAAPVKYATRVTITTERGSLYHGWVKSEVNKCERRRHVVLFKKRQGPDRKLGSVLSKRDQHDGRPTGGEWGMIKARHETGHAYAMVKSKKNDRFVCHADRSPIYEGGARVYG